MIARSALAAVLSGLLLATSPSLEAAAKPDIPGIVVPDLPADVVQALRSQRRMALVIGNGEYADSPLRKPPRDARSIAAALDYLGFEVTLHTNLGGEAMTRAVDAFADRLRASGALGLFFYSGHGVETSDGVGYLIPVDLSTAADETALPYRAMPLGYVLGRMEGARDGIDILLIDACRNSRWVRSFKGPSGTGGTLRPMEAGKRSLVGFSTRTGQPASEGEADTPHSPFTQHLLSAMFQPGLRLRTVLDRVQDEVRAETKNLQIPAYRTTLGRTEVYFIPPSTGHGAPQPQGTMIPSAPPVAEKQGSISNLLREPEAPYLFFASGLLLSIMVLVPIILRQRSLARSGLPFHHPKAPSDPRDEVRATSRRWTVDAGGGADFRTIGAAIKRAASGDAIAIAPGVYAESLVVEKDLYLEGTGNDRGDVVIRPKAGEGLVFKAQRGAVRNMTFVGNTTKRSCIDITSGRLLVADNDLSGSGLAVILVHGAGADPVVTGNRIHDGRQGGIFVYENGKGRFDNNDIFANALSGIEVKEGGDPTVSGNRIHDGKQGGIIVHQNGKGRFDNNDIFANAFSGIEVKKGGDPTVSGNRIHDGKSVGVIVHQNGKGRFDNNDIFANALPGIEVREGGDPTVSGNRIHDGKNVGIFVYENGKGRFENNDIFANAFAGIEVKEGGDPTVSGNRIHDGKTAGIFVYQNGKGRFDNNDIFANAHSGIVVGEGGDPTVSGNRINRNTRQAIWVAQDGRGTYTGNDLRGNHGGTWKTEPGAQIEQSDNTP